MWDWSSTQIDFSQSCWTFDGYNGCDGAYAGAGYPVIIYERIKQKTIKKVAEKVLEYQAKEKRVEISPESAKEIVEYMADTWPKEEMYEMMDLYDIGQEQAVLSYKATIRTLFDDEDVALILILANI